MVIDLRRACTDERCASREKHVCDRNMPPHIYNYNSNKYTDLNRIPNAEMKADLGGPVADGMLERE